MTDEKVKEILKTIKSLPKEKREYILAYLSGYVFRERIESLGKERNGD